MYNNVTTYPIKLGKEAIIKKILGAGVGSLIKTKEYLKPHCIQFFRKFSLIVKIISKNNLPFR